MTMWAGSGYGSGLSNTALTMENTAVFAPMPSAKAARAAIVNPGLRTNIRREYFASVNIASNRDQPSFECSR